MSETIDTSAVPNTGLPGIGSPGVAALTLPLTNTITDGSQPDPAPAQSSPASLPVQTQPVQSQAPTQQQPQRDTRSFSEKMAASANKIGALPEAHGVGGWARSLVGSVVDSLGDAAAANEKPLPPGAGWLAGAERTLQARSQRIANQNQMKEDNQRKDALNMSEVDKNRAMTAHANSEMLHEQSLNHQVGENAILASIATGKSAVENLTTSPSPAPILNKDIDSDKIQQLIADKTIDPTVSTAFATGRKQTGENPDGTPIYRTTYTVVGDSPQVKVSDDMAARITKYSGTKIPAGTFLSGAQFNWLSQQASNAEAATIARNKTLVDNELATDAQAQKLESVQLGPLWNKNLAAAKNDPLKALAMMQSDPATAAKYPHLFNDVREAYGSKNFDSLIEEREKSAQKLRDQSDTALTKLENDPAEMTGEKAPTAIAMLQSKLTDPNLSPADRPRVVRLISQAKTAQTANLAYEGSKKATEQAVADGDPVAAARLLVSRVVAPAQLISSRKPEFAQKAFTAAEKLEPGWNAAVADAQYKVASNPQQSVFFGSANSLLDKGGTLDQLAANHAKLQNKKFPIFNKYEDLAKFQSGDPALAGFKQTVLGAADDYAKVMGGGVGTDGARNELVESFSNALNNGQMASALSSARAAVTSQRDARLGTNPYLKTMYSGTAAESQPQQREQNQTQRQPQAQQAPAGTIHMQKPDGTFMYVPAGNQAAAEKLGAKVAQ